MSFEQVLEISGLCIGLLYLWWEYHADAKVWLASLVMPAISMWIYYGKGLYADFGINIYYLIIAVYGFIAWTRKSSSGGKSGNKLRIRHIPLAVSLLASLVGIALWVGICRVLVLFTDSTVPVADAFTTALSIVGLWMMARKYAEQWLIWFAVDIASSGLYLYKGLYFYCVLYVIYTVISLFGYRKWLRLMRDEK